MFSSTSLYGAPARVLRGVVLVGLHSCLTYSREVAVGPFFRDCKAERLFLCCVVQRVPQRPPAPHKAALLLPSPRAAAAPFFPSRRYLHLRLPPLLVASPTVAAAAPSCKGLHGIFLLRCLPLV
ncbi:hypothetical protein Taro_040554 [Colocasia esculenta]|uniref:Uncharacterized protein n=1 Tax=Colocasia esculenta TaxID=4460 RepID=A0A843WM81_COLES|nr:hypothetical protein [Colocasia esculenta]